MNLSTQNNLCGTEIGDFQSLRVMLETGRMLTNDEMARIGGCVGYALKATLAGEELSEPTCCLRACIPLKCWLTVLDFAYDSRTSIRTSPDIAQALLTAARRIQEGTPVRKTDRVGPAGTRLIAGIGRCRIEFELI